MADAYDHDIAELIRLVDGLPGAVFHCACRRPYRIGIAPELKAVLERVRGEAMRRAGRTDMVPETGRFAMLDLDD